MIELKKIVTVFLMLMACFNLQTSDRDTKLHIERVFKVNKDFLSGVHQGNEIKVLAAIESFEDLFVSTKCMENYYPIFINQPCCGNNPALHHAVNSNYENIACLLLQLGANSKYVDKSGRSLEDIAQRNGNTYLQGILIDANAD